MNVVDNFCCCHFPNPQVLMCRYVNKYLSPDCTKSHDQSFMLQILLCMSCCFHQWCITLSKIIDGKPAFLGKVDFQSSFANVKGFHLGRRYSPSSKSTHRHPGPHNRFVFKCLMTTSPFILFPTATPLEKMIAQIFSSHPPTLRSGPLPLALTQIFFSSRIDSQRFYLTFGFLSATLSQIESQGRNCTSYFNPTLSIMGQ
jgi:hypothetical protein